MGEAGDRDEWQAVDHDDFSRQRVYVTALKFGRDAVPLCSDADAVLACRRGLCHCRLEGQQSRCILDLAPYSVYSLYDGRCSGFSCCGHGSPTMREGDEVEQLYMLQAERDYLLTSYDKHRKHVRRVTSDWTVPPSSLSPQDRWGPLLYQGMPIGPARRGFAPVGWTSRKQFG